MEEQVNSGFMQSPVHQQQNTSSSELETSFSGQTGLSAEAASSANRAAVGLNGLLIPQQVNGGPFIKHQGVPVESPSSLSSVASGQSQPISYINGSINLPWQYYQYLQQLAMMNPAMAMPTGDLTQSAPYMQPMQMTNPQAMSQETQAIGLVAPVAPGQPAKTQVLKKAETAMPTSEIYEEIPNYKMYSDLPKLPAPRQQISQEPPDDSTDSLLRTNNTRKKTNPLYGGGDAVESGLNPSEPCSSEPFSSHYSTGKDRSCSKCLCITILLVTIISLTALIITLLVATGILSFYKVVESPVPVEIITQPAAASAEINTNITDLLLLYEQGVDEQTSKLQLKIEQLEQQLNSLNSSQQSHETDLAALNDRFPTGAINPALCKHGVDSYSTEDTRGDSLPTLWMPDYSLLVGEYVVVGASCTSEGYHNSLLLTRTQNNNEQYQCHCNGPIENAARARCSIDYWICPTIT